jgi:hypothetical protein
VQKKSPLKYSFKVNNSYLSVTVSGHFSLSEAKKMYTDALDTLVDKKLSKLFFDVYKVKGYVKTVDRYFLGEFAALESLKYMEKGLPRLTASFYGIEPIIDPDRFGELVARNLGLNLKVGTDKKEALHFLGVE